MTEGLKDVIQRKYGDAAERAAAGARAGCCDSGCGCGDPITSDLYNASETDGLPEAAVAASLGCGNPTALIDLQAGETVLDLGSGGGIDVLLSARRVGPTGKVYGLDMTDRMLALARENQRKAGVDERRVPEGGNRADSAPGQLGGRDHLELRHQPVVGQGAGAARGVPRAEAGRPLRRLRRRRARRGAGRHPQERRAVGGLRRRRARRSRTTSGCSATPGSPASTSSRGASTTSTTRATS